MTQIPVLVTGIIPAAGIIPTAGSGFTYTHTNGTGLYVFTFTEVFSATPLVLATINQAHTAGRVDTVNISGVGPTGFTAETGILTVAPVDGLVDIAFIFEAKGVV